MLAEVRDPKRKRPLGSHDMDGMTILIRILNN